MLNGKLFVAGGRSVKLLTMAKAGVMTLKILSRITGLTLLIGFALQQAALAETYNANKISFRDVTGTVEIVTTSGDALDITVSQGKTYRQLNVTEKDGVVLVEGERWKDDGDRNCCDNRIVRESHPRKGRKLTTGKPVDEGLFENYPTITVSLPLQSDVEFIDARVKLEMDRLAGALSLDACYVYGETGDVDEAVVGLVEGSRLVMGNVKSGLEVDISGDADLMAGDAAVVDVDMAGPGDVLLGDIGGIFDVSIAGSGLVRATRMDGPMTVRIAGSGAVAVKDGKADRLRATIDGSGGVFFGGEVSEPDLRLYGSSEVRMGSVDGRITRSGRGDIYVGEKLIER